MSKRSELPNTWLTKLMGQFIEIHTVLFSFFYAIFWKTSGLPHPWKRISLNGECEFKKHVHTHTHTHKQTQTHTHTHIYIHIYTHIHIHIIYIYWSMYVHIYAFVLIHPYTHICIYIHTYRIYRYIFSYTVKKMTVHHMHQMPKCLSCQKNHFGDE